MIALRRCGRAQLLSLSLFCWILAGPERAVAAPVAFGGHLYEFVPGLTSWQEARTAAAARTIDGTPGYLATTTSAEELAFVAALTGGANAWLGGTDEAVEGTWVWATGPEAGTEFWKNGAPVGGAFTGWHAGEPNDFQNEDYLAVYRQSWYDWNIRMGYVVEYSFDEVGFSFAMAGGFLGAVRNESPAGVQIVRLDLALPDGLFFDTAEASPGSEFAPLLVSRSSAPVTVEIPDGSQTDGLREVSISFSGFDAMEEIRFSGDVDRLDDPDGAANAAGTHVTAWFSNGAVVSGSVVPRASTILGTSWPLSVRLVRAPDWDVDGVPDDVDVCPGVADPAQSDRGGVGPGSAPDGIGDACQCGDVNGDGRITLVDATIVQRALLTPPAATMTRAQLCDVTGDAACTFADAVALRRALLQPPGAALADRCVPTGP